MDDFLYLNIPAFHVRYKRWKKYGYSKADEKENMKEVLCEAGRNYCMYCYTRIKVDNKLFGNLEHALEKSNSNKLIECVPNIGMACAVCNQSFKRIGERRRKVPDDVQRSFEDKSRCAVNRRKQCTVACKALRELQRSYSELPGAEIILQPMGIFGKESGNEMAVQYDVMKMEFQPNTNLHDYSERELVFIRRHIQRFRLNDPKYRTRQLAEYIKNLIDNEGVMPRYEYNNLIVQLFAEKLEGKTREEKVRICSRIYAMIFLRV